MNKYIKIYYLLAIFAYVVGTIGGCLSCIHYGEYVFAVTTLILAAMAFPVVKDYFNKLKD